MKKSRQSKNRWRCEQIACHGVSECQLLVHIFSLTSFEGYFIGKVRMRQVPEDF